MELDNFTVVDKGVPAALCDDLRVCIADHLARGRSGSLPDSTFFQPKKDSKWEKGRTHECLCFGVHTQTNRVSGAPVAELPEPFVQLVAHLKDSGHVPVDSPLNAVLVEVFNPGQWLPPRPEPLQFLRPTVIVALCGEEAAEDGGVGAAEGAENMLHIAGEDIKMVANGVFENSLSVKLATGTVVATSQGETSKIALGVSRRSCQLIVLRSIANPPNTKKKGAAPEPIPRVECEPVAPEALAGPSASEDSVYSTPVVEREHVHRLYDTIASHWSRTRHKPWPRVEAFLRGLPKHSVVADVGCGNGKYMGCVEAQFMLGSDRSGNLLQICAERGYEVMVCDNMLLPYRDGVFDAVLSIAVLHHFSTEARRLRALQEIVRVLRVGGVALVYAWAQEQGGESRRHFAHQDVLVPWHHKDEHKETWAAKEGHELHAQAHAQSEAEREVLASHGEKDETRGSTLYKRYCHVYREGELEALAMRVGGVQVEQSYYDTSNWCIVIRKL